VALVEAADIGGTCVNRGCIPSKIWLRAAHLLRSIRDGGTFGIHATVDKVDPKGIVERKNGVANDIRMGMQGLLSNYGVEVKAGRAFMKTPREVEVEGAVFETQKIILAVGSGPGIPDVTGLDKAVWTTDQILDMTKIPSSVLICGSDPIEMEMATLLNGFGCSVTVASAARRPLPREDAETSRRLSAAMKEQGVEVLTSLTLESVSTTKGGYACRLSGAKGRTVEVERVLVAARKPSTGKLGLEQAGVALTDDGGIRVNHMLETSVKGVYAVGDATGGWMLSHCASAMAVVAAENAMGRTGTFSSHLVPRAVWTLPEIGAVGLTEEDAEAKGIGYETGDFPYSINGLAMSRDQMTGMVKIITDPRYGEILGVHIVGANATELVGEAVLAMQLECTAKEFARSIRAHPTISETLVDAARDASGWALYLPKR
jgi:dihydrolipoamide dehydrogenase